MKAVTAAGGAVFRSGDEDGMLRVLLIYRRGVWDLPKGKLEDSESLEECAIREVTEETGSAYSPKIITPLLKTYHEYEQDEVDYAKTTHWFAMQFPSASEIKFYPQIEEGIEQVKWFPVSEAKKRVGYANLIEVLKSLEGQVDV